MVIKKYLLLTTALTYLLLNTSYAVPVTGFTMDFLSLERMPNARIDILETGQKTYADKQGQFTFDVPAGSKMTLIFRQLGYRSVQSETFTVPEKGLIGPYDNITFQAPSLPVYYAYGAAMGGYFEDPEKCQVVTTITQFHKTLDDLPQGEPGAIAVLTPNPGVAPRYFGIIKHFKPPFYDKTDPFGGLYLKATTEDGGVLWSNVPPSDKPYTITAIKSGKKFTSAQFICRKGAFINISPPRGPSVIP